MLKHPNIVRLYDVIETDKYIGIILDYASGGELFDYLAEKGRLNEEETRVLFGQLCLAVAYVHEKGIVHRDLKLENVFTSEDGSRCFLGDFSLATNEPMVCDFGVGTRRYMSPGMVSTSLILYLWHSQIPQQSASER